MTLNTQQLLIPEERIITPLVPVLNNIAPKNHPKITLETTPEFTEVLDNLFPEQKHQDKNIQTAKKILGPLADLFTEEGLKEVVVEIEYLTESWLDDFERKIFNGQTLNELLHEKGGE
ncbi:hypothetical protein M1349_05225 [Patescibacteria group bacterium]|nr:hypothetical protein [Patescibacteria group bacterium]